MRRNALTLMAFFALSLPAYSAQESDPPLVAIDENLWVTFYDVPSRRFRAIRDAFVRREFELAGSDLLTSANYLTIEANRALPAIAERLTEVSSQMTWIAANFEDPSVTSASLDKLFGRAHWLLAQHYLYMARLALERDNNRNSGRYLWAATHHLERSVLWSNARIDRNVVRALQGLRDLATRLQNPELAAKARREKPIARAEKVLRDLGKTIDRPVVLPQR